jgi:hypothetical protein
VQLGNPTRNPHDTALGNVEILMKEITGTRMPAREKECIFRDMRQQKFILGIETAFRGYPQKGIFL